MIRTKRNRREIALHLGSCLLIAVPLFYWLSLEPENVWPVMCVLGLQGTFTTVLRLRKVNVHLQLWFLIPAALASFVAGSMLLAWPLFNVAALSSQELLILAVFVTFSTLSNGLSIFSFPVEKD